MSEASPDLATSIKRLLGLEVDFLAKQAHPDSGPHEEPAVIGLIEAGEDLHERGLAGTVGADQPDPLAGADFEFQLAENRIAGELPAQSLSGNEDHLWRSQDASREMPLRGAKGDTGLRIMYGSIVADRVQTRQARS